MTPSMETMISSSSLSIPQEVSTYDGISMQQSLLFSDTLKDLKNLRAQLYSAAEYFEVSYTNDDQKQIVVNTLKDYAVRAIVNTVDHLGSASYKVNGLVDEKAEEVTVTELRVSCIEQRLRTCQEYNDREGLSQQSLVITAPKYHRQYILPVEESIGNSAQAGVKQSSFSIDLGDHGLQQFRTAYQKTTRDIPSSVRKARSPSPSPRSREFLFADKRSVSPASAPDSHIFRSGSLSSRPTTPNSSNTRRSTSPISFQTGRSSTPNRRQQYPSETRKSASMHLHAEKDPQKETDQYPSKGKRLLKALLSRRKSKNDPMLYSYLDEY
ncbi:protein ABIL3-like protein [Cinnamomum micranthum f. kanehirae]|uniref:Protein ABIL3-like protein n=1 Tax=Cinnamomum micranthum f. kanehirae TaxID=337451 RepID=A0A3S3NSD2_9MAGN|nr:protein ABIL3-like protein [Cinnamomum micranthum f. kanehirae]